MHRLRLFVIGLMLCLVNAATANAPKAPAVVELFEDDADMLIPQLGGDDGALAGSSAKREQRDVYSGVASIRVTPFQRFSPSLKGWNYPIVEKPASPHALVAAVRTAAAREPRRSLGRR